MNFSQLLTEINLSLRSAWSVIATAKYALLAVILGFVFFEIIYWSFNFNILSVVLSSGIGIGEKTLFVLGPFKNIFSSVGWFVGTLMVVVAVVQGISLSLLVYTIKHQRRLNAGVVGGGSAAGVLAAVGLGCSACGTSVITPIVAIFASTSAVAISEKLTVIAPLLGVVVGLIAIYYLGLQVANINTQIASKTTVCDVPRRSLRKR